MPCRIFARSYLVLLLIAISVSFARAGELPSYSLGGDVIHGGSAGFAKAGGDTVNLMAARNDPTNEPGEPFYFGDFEDAVGNPAWNGWTHYDITAPTMSWWNVSNYNQPDPGNHAAWCGDINIPSCGAADTLGGYGNNWNESIEFRQSVLYPGMSSTVTITATLIHDTEVGYDYTYLSYLYQGQLMADMQSWDGEGTVAVSNSVTYQPTEYFAGTDIAVYFRFESDSGWSDEDCSWPTAGACQVDDINVHLVNGPFVEDYFEDFEHGGVPDDFGIWNVVLPAGVGDFAKIWTGLGDIDPCVENTTPQVAFIDDGVVVPGTGGSHCINWCYGPGGYIVNTTGGLAGYDQHLQNAIESPVMDWPAPKSGVGPDDDGIIFSYGVFVHEDLTADSPGMFYTWGVRSADTDNSAGNGIQDITEQPWGDRHFVIYGGPSYSRGGGDVTDLMNPGRDQVQVQLTVYELGWVWYWTGNDGYPAPYFDNVTVKVFPYHGPGMTAREIDLAQDNFPARGTIDYGDLGSHSVRFDMARNISPASHLNNDPGDSIYATIVPVRSGAGLDGDPQLHYTMDRNPVFDPYRTSGLPAVGLVPGQPAVSGGFPASQQWAFDLPDTGFLFPGDVLHYYISATDAIGGVGGTDPQTSTLPADLAGYGVFHDPMGYNSTFVVHALPTIKADNSHPSLLFINDFANRGGENKWYSAMRNLAIYFGDKFDIYYVNGPSSGVGNGIGGRANSLLLQGYQQIIYTSGDLGVNTIANGDFNNDAGDDVGTLTGWLDIGVKGMFLTGDELVTDLMQAGAATRALAEDYLGVNVSTNDLRPHIGNQASPFVATMAGNLVFNPGNTSWIAHGGCPGVSTFDAVDVRAGTERLAEFRDPSGATGAYIYSAASLNPTAGLAGTSRVISMPYDLMNIYTDPGMAGDYLPARAKVLRDVLLYLGLAGDPTGPSPAPSAVTFMTSNYPNPFNPSTTINYSLPRAGHLRLSIYNVRGQLIKTLIDGPRPAGVDQTIVWDGSDNLGSSVASGIYFYEARAMGDVLIGKMTLLK
ncbi:MAG: FlgD immunoglobulin-like domain containing protein [Candidatus Krumholzibacteriota bacterium]